VTKLSSIPRLVTFADLSAQRSATGASLLFASPLIFRHAFCTGVQFAVLIRS
jgi:hypothetical protein